MRVSPLVTLGNVPRRSLLGYGPSSSVLRQLVCKLKRGWKQTMGWRKRDPFPELSSSTANYVLRRRRRRSFPILSRSGTPDRSFFFSDYGDDFFTDDDSTRHLRLNPNQDQDLRLESFIF
ncbi:hypothetical protein HKD37_03G008136 [Glycine soja]